MAKTAYDGQVGSNIIIYKTLYRNINLDALNKLLQIRNPEFDAISRFSKSKFFKKKVDKLLTFYSYDDETECVVIPRNTPLVEILGEYAEGIKLNDIRNIGQAANFDHFINLRDYQAPYMKTIIREELSDIVMEMPCGHGKTLSAIYLAHTIARKTLILVPTIFLAQQWEAKIKEFTTATVAIFKSTMSAPPKGFDFTICSLDLFTSRNLDTEFMNQIGHVILDEAHRVGADQYIPILDVIPAKYRTALTATFRRPDNMHIILGHHFGKVYSMPYHLEKPKVFPVLTGIKASHVVSKNKPHKFFQQWLDDNGVRYNETAGTIEYSYSDEYVDQVVEQVKSGTLRKTHGTEILSRLKGSKAVSYSLVETYLSQNGIRLRKLKSMIQSCLDEGRCVLYLGKRKETLKQLAKYFKEYKVSLVISDTNQRTEKEEHFLQKEAQLILGIYQLAKEGLDIDRLDTLILSSPLIDTEQPLGRIGRHHPDKKSPVAFYVVDDNFMTLSTYNKARQYIPINGILHTPIPFKDVDKILALNP